MNKNKMNPPHDKLTQDQGGGLVFSMWKEADMNLRRESRNVERVHNPALAVGQRSCLSGFYAPKHYWTSRLQEMLDEHERTHVVHEH